MILSLLPISALPKTKFCEQGFFVLFTAVSSGPRIMPGTYLSLYAFLLNQLRATNKQAKNTKTILYRKPYIWGISQLIFTTMVANKIVVIFFLSFLRSPPSNMVEKTCLSGLLCILLFDATRNFKIIVIYDVLRCTVLGRSDCGVGHTPIAGSSFYTHSHIKADTSDFSDILEKKRGVTSTKCKHKLEYWTCLFSKSSLFVHLQFL